MGALWFCPLEPAEACSSSDPRAQLWAHLACLGWGLRGSNAPPREEESPRCTH